MKIQSELYGNIESVYGNGIHATYCEEAYEIESEDKLETLSESIRGRIDEPDAFKQITVTFNPWNEHHWLKRTFFDEKTRKADTFAITTTFRCNEWLDDGDRKRYLDLYKTNPRRAKVSCDGDWGVSEGLVFEDNRSEEHTSELQSR